jgi:hypothetical protein
MQIEIVKEYLIFRKYKIKIIHTGNLIVVDKCSITKEREEAISISWLEG